MADTKKLDRAKRKASKRVSRRVLKKLFAGLTRKQRSELKESEKGLKAFVAEQQKASE